MLKRLINNWFWLALCWLNVALLIVNSEHRAPISIGIGVFAISACLFGAYFRGRYDAASELIRLRRERDVLGAYVQQHIKQP